MNIVYVCKCGWSGNAPDVFIHRDGTDYHNPKPIEIRNLTGIERENVIQIPRAGVMVER